MQESKYVILIVDDSRTFRVMQKQALEGLNFIVKEAESGQQALDIFEKSPVDLVLLDVQMTDMDGFTTCTKLRLLAGNKPVPIVMITGSDDVNSIDKAYSVGASDFIIKPLKWHLINYRLRNIIRSNNDYLELQKVKENLLAAQTEINQLHENVSTLIRNFKQMSLDQIRETKKTIHLKDHLTEIILSLNPVLKNTRLQVNIHCEDELVIDTYPSVIFQIISLLIMNSITHAFEPDEKGNLTISASQENNRIIIKYSDSGKGLSKEVLKNISEPFITTNRDASYIGLGLHVVYNHVIQLLGGSILCESELGHGTTFTIAIPVSGKNNVTKSSR